MALFSNHTVWATATTPNLQIAFCLYSENSASVEIGSVSVAIVPRPHKLIQLYQERMDSQIVSGMCQQAGPWKLQPHCQSSASCHWSNCQVWMGIIWTIDQWLLSSNMSGYQWWAQINQWVSYNHGYWKYMTALEFSAAVSTKHFHAPQWP